MAISGSFTRHHAPAAVRFAIRCDTLRHRTPFHPEGRRHARDFAFRSSRFRLTLGFRRNNPPEDEDGKVARPKRTAEDRIRVVLEPSDRSPAYDPSKRDPRIVELVRLLARQAAREFVEAERERERRDRLPD